MTHDNLVRPLFVSLVALAVAILAGVVLAEPSEIRDPTGVSIVGPAKQAGPTDESLAIALSEAWDFASAHPEAVGYPWPDRARGELVLSAVAPLGESLLRQWVPVNSAAAATPRRIRFVQHSWGTLEGVKHGATFLVQAGVPDADAIYQTLPDAEHNRVIITINRRSDALLAALATRYGDTIAVRIAPDGLRGMPMVLGAEAPLRVAAVVAGAGLVIALTFYLWKGSRLARFMNGTVQGSRLGRP